MSTSTMRSARAATRIEGGARNAPGRVGAAWIRARRFVSTVLFGSDAARLLDSRDVNSYLRTTDG